MDISDLANKCRKAEGYSSVYYDSEGALLPVDHIFYNKDMHTIILSFIRKIDYEDLEEL